MPRFALRIEYDGGPFAGWQRQADQPSVQGAIEAFTDLPDLAAYSLSPNDTHGWCECANCRAMDSPDEDIAWAWRVMEFNNRVAERLYWQRYVACDLDYPGPEGYVVRTACDPWGTGKNAIKIGRAHV